MCIRDRPTGLTRAQTVKTPAYWMFTVGLTLVSFIGMGMTPHIIAYLTDIGYSSSTASSVQAAVMWALVLAEVVLGAVFDRVGPVYTSLLTGLSLLLSVLLLLFAGSSPLMPWLFAFVLSLIHIFLAEQNLTQEQAAATLGKTQSTIANKLRLLKLDPGLRAKIRKAGLTERHARALLRLPEELRETALSRILSQKLTVAATDRLVDRLLEPQPVPAPRKKAIVKDVRLFLNTVDRALSIMKTSGIPARAEMQERDGCYEYRILIPK